MISLNLLIAVLTAVIALMILNAHDKRIAQKIRDQIND